MNPHGTTDDGPRLTTWVITRWPKGRVQGQPDRPRAARCSDARRGAWTIHFFMQQGAGAISTPELPVAEMKNRLELAFDIPPRVAKMLIEYRDRIAPKIIGHRPTRLFVNINGMPKSQATVAYLITSYLQRRAGIILTPHQFRHLSAKVVLDAEPGAFEIVRQQLGHKSIKTTTAAYTGINSRRAARHHHRLVQQALETQTPVRGRKKRASQTKDRKKV